MQEPTASSSSLGTTANIAIIGFMTPEAVHYGQAKALLRQRAETLNAAFQANPMRFKGIAPQPPRLPDAAWINPPKKENVAENTDHLSTLN